MVITIETVPTRNGGKIVMSPFFNRILVALRMEKVNTFVNDRIDL